MDTKTQAVTWWKSGKPAAAALFGPLVEITIDGKTVSAPTGSSVLSAATAAGIYIPALCAHPALPPSCQRGDKDVGCGLCVVEVAGADGAQKSCSMAVEAGLSISTTSPEINRMRAAAIAKTLTTHPHVCLTCPQRDGCSRTSSRAGSWMRSAGWAGVPPSGSGGATRSNTSPRQFEPATGS